MALRLHPLAFALFVVIFFTTSACQKPFSRQLHKNQAIIDEAENLISRREFTKAAKTVSEAISKLSQIIEKNPDVPSLYLLRSQAYFTLFQAKNTLLIENAAPRARSLVRLPSKDQYIDYDISLKKAFNDVQFVLGKNDAIDEEKKAIAYILIASIFRLEIDNLAKSDQFYSKAIDIYKEQLNKLQKTKMGSPLPKTKIVRLENRINFLRLSQVEVNLLAENWVKSLNLCEQIVAGKDLKYFSVNFERLNQDIADIDNKITRIKEEQKGYRREQRIVKLIEERKKKMALENRRSLSENPYQEVLIEKEEELTHLKNNLIYRIICFHNLQEKQMEEESRSILRRFYPHLDAQFNAIVEYQ